ncbi:hypothetical protein [Halogeometricum borinquense]|uniref:Uncharacterized protein n=1 Tax=Halogeometricum borinquense (strain ATCC 700274 / DSM 11551 / JCM 10706 / KCTC 4070 / PR3) TaxID=469382 RepID=E4NWH0_HALBP|nr:hypothetical protein [Halogeometricum borinquense]ADQ69390.1 hypothetical protein Hbor_36840 [Halogeometricum borinquense DSM 11551]
MPDENRFSGLGDVVEEEEPEKEVEVSADESSDREKDATENTATSDADEQMSSSSGPAFEFEDTTAKSVYVRPETLSVMDDAEFEVESVLRREHDVRDLTGREFHDALVRVAAEHPEEVAEIILSTRDIPFTEHD